MQKRTIPGKSRPTVNATSLAACLKAIEQKLNWGRATDWSHQEFVSLSEKVLTTTGVSLSANTLKRVWGRLPYDSSPSTSTLNALAQFIGYENWVSYRSSNNGALEPEQSKKDQPFGRHNEGKRHRIDLRWYVISGAVAIFFTVILVRWLLLSDIKASTTEIGSPIVQHLSEIRFDARKTSIGVPNTIIFNYNLSGVEASSFQIQQNWDRRRRFELDPTQNTVSSTYYIPGYWSAKLLADASILRETDVYIGSDGWLATVNTEPMPIYFRAPEIVSETLLVKKDSYQNAVRNQSTLPSLSYHYVDNFDASLDQLFAEITLKNSQEGGMAACRFTSLILLGSKGVVSIPLSIPGCVGDLRLRIGDVVVDGATNDLSDFGCDFNESQSVGVHIFESRALIYLNDHLIRTIPYFEPLGSFAGLRAKFNGHGYIESVIVKDSAGRHLLEHGME